MDDMLQTRSLKPFKALCVLIIAGDITVACSQNSGTSTTGSGGLSCNNFVVSSADNCDTCLHQTCCAEVTACGEVQYCTACFSGIASPDVQCNRAAPPYSTLSACAYDRCLKECYPGEFCRDGANAADGGGCVATEPDGAVTSAECQGVRQTIVRGILDGMPFEKTYASGQPFVQQDFTPAYLNLSLPNAAINLFWQDVCLYADSPPVPVTGHLRIPDQNTDRTVEGCSLLWRTQDKSTGHDIYRFNVSLMNGDQLTGCTQ